jgi:hypothetical protein
LAEDALESDDAAAPDVKSTSADHLLLLACDSPEAEGLFNTLLVPEDPAVGLGLFAQAN